KHSTRPWRGWPEMLAAGRRLTTVITAAGLGLTACSRGVPPPHADAEWFVDLTRETGLRFEHFAGMSGGLYDPELIGPGVPLFDYAGDADLDVLFVQGDRLAAAGQRTTTTSVPTVA